MSKDTDRMHRILEIEWEVPDLPRFVGPFESDVEAREWARVNIPNGVWSVAPVTFPYATH